MIGGADGELKVEMQIEGMKRGNEDVALVLGEVTTDDDKIRLLGIDFFRGVLLNFRSRRYWKF